MKLSKLTVFFGTYIILSSLFMRQVWEILERRFGKEALTLGLASLFVTLTWLMLYKAIRSRLNPKKIAAICLLIIWGYIFAWRQPYSSETAHVLEFALLGWMSANDLNKNDESALKQMVFAFLFAALIGFLEEAF